MAGRFASARFAATNNSYSLPRSPASFRTWPTNVVSARLMATFGVSRVILRDDDYSDEITGGALELAI